jgi:hypothetical protein
MRKYILDVTDEETKNKVQEIKKKKDARTVEQYTNTQTKSALSLCILKFTDDISTEKNSSK